MPPKKKEDKKNLKQIVKIFNPVLFWQYSPPNPQISQKITMFFHNFEKELKQLIKKTNSLEENYSIICQKMGHAVHPCFNTKHKKGQFPQLQNTDYGEKSAIFLNHKVDSITLKVLKFVLTHFQINSIKFSNNQLDAEVEDFMKLFQKQDAIRVLFFEWNPLSHVVERSNVFLSIVRPSIKHLILRQNGMGDQICQNLLEKIKTTPNIALQGLDLSGNQLTQKIGSSLSQFIEGSKHLEFIGLNHNMLNTRVFFNEFFNSIGEIKLSEEEIIQYKESIKQRDEVLERNKKKKRGAIDEPVPSVKHVKQTEEGFFQIKNLSLRMINLGRNEIKGSIKIFQKFMNRKGQQIELFLEGNDFTKKEKEKLMFYNNIFV